MWGRGLGWRCLRGSEDHWVFVWEGWWIGEEGGGCNLMADR